MTNAAPTRTNVVVTLAAIVIVIAGMKAAATLIIPFLIATFLALITVRPMLWLQQNRVPTVLAALLIVLTMLAIITVTGVVVGRSLALFTRERNAVLARLGKVGRLEPRRRGLFPL